MRKTDNSLNSSNQYISDNLERIRADDIDFYSSNIFKGLRDFIEVVVVKLSGEEYYSQEVFNRNKNSIFAQGKYKFLKNFHSLLQKSMSHYTEVGENATRLIFKYYEYLLRTKKLLKSEYNIDILDGLEVLEKYINKDEDLKEYYQKIAEIIYIPTGHRRGLNFNDVYYIDRVKTFFIDQEIYYEITFRIANDYTSKFDRIIAFTKEEIVSNYAVKLNIDEDYIELYDKVIPIKIITDYEISIRPCELKNFSQILFGRHMSISKTIEYKNLMNYMKTNKLNLLDIVISDSNVYENFKLHLANDAKSSQIRDILDRSRGIILPNMSGSNILRYLLFVMNNSIVKRQSAGQSNGMLSDLYLDYKTIPFDNFPYKFFLSEHTPRIVDLFQCIDLNDRESELFARFIQNNTEIKGQLYTQAQDIKTFENIDDLKDEYNDRLYSGHKPNAEIIHDRGQVYIYGYEATAIEVINKLEVFSQNSISGYSDSVKSWIREKGDYIDDPIKEKALTEMFEKSTLSLIYGSAGTGKTKLIEYISEYFKSRPTDASMLFLAHTHTAINNLKRRIGNISNASFDTVKKYTYRDVTVDVLIIDECSTIGNDDMYKLLNKIDFKVLVLVGDIYQIESIRFENWFYLLKKFFPDFAIELNETRRTDDQELLGLWNAVRNMEDDIAERISRNNFASSLNESIFNREDEDEIILCLNYNGLYGINNINILLQQGNPNPELKWGIHTFKINDPVLFNEIGRFDGILHNNLKGAIRDIRTTNNESGERHKIVFDIEIEDVLTEFDVAGTEVELIETKEKSSIIRFYVNKIGSQDEDSNELKDDIIPFQIAYALSIHKSQGLEYNSVKLIITDEIEEQVTHSIFYTAITRAKDKLKIYWSPQTQTEVLSKIKPKFDDRDYYLLRSKIEE